MFEKKSWRSEKELAQSDRPVPLTSSRRCPHASTIVISNLNFAEWGDAFPANKMLGASALDRLRHGAYRIVLDGASYRIPRPPPGSSKTAIAKAQKTPTN